MDTGRLSESQRAEPRRPAFLTYRYGLLASSIAGRTVAVAVAHDAAWSDGRTIYVRPEDARREVITQAALLRAGSLDAAVVGALTGRTALSRRYLALEGRRALAGLADILPAIVFADVTGPVAEASAIPTDSPATSLLVARSRAAVPDPPSWFGTIRTRQIRRAAGPHSPESIEGAQDADRADDSAASKGSRVLKALRNPAGLSGLSRLLLRHFGETFVAGQDGVGAARTADRIVAGERHGAGAVVGTPGGHEATPAPPRAPGVARYPEWDAGRGAYRADWCSVIAVTPPDRGARTLDRPARHDALRRALAPLGAGAMRVRRQLRGLDLDLDAVIDARVLAVAGHSGADAVHVDNLRRRRELGVLVLLDASGSASEVDPEGAVLFERQRRAAAALLDTLSILGDRVAGYSFQSMGRNNVVVTSLKDFDEPFGARQQRRLGAVEPGGYTRLGAAVRHATRVLREDSGMRHRVLIVVSDGFPYDIGYEGGYAEADARRALAEARHRGIGCVCLNLGSTTGSDTLDRVYGAAAHATARDVDELAPAMRRLVWGALREAERRGSARA